ncbi:hypothetical protein OHB00_06030 [Streptomyces sp. NBC_00631]|uniref:hypothetical protein n=1 Tax=Streptomyces sp. NBC_00631 TaxID=2975793 RepID=UPI0030DE87E4
MIELVPGDNAVVLFARSDDDLPDPDVVDELRMTAYERAGAADLGASEAAHDLLNLAQVMADGVLGAAAWEGLLATRRFVDRWRASHRSEPLPSAEAATSQALRAADIAGYSVEGEAGVRAATRESNGWSVTVDLSDGRCVRITLDPAGSVADVQRVET